MTVKLNQPAYDFAKTLVSQGRMVADLRGDWHKHQPSAQEENDFIRENGIDEYAKWHLGVDTDEDQENKGRYKFPYGDFKNVHRCGVLAAESRAAQNKHPDIENAAAHLHGMIDGRASVQS